MIPRKILQNHNIRISSNFISMKYPRFLSLVPKKKEISQEKSKNEMKKQKKDLSNLI